MLQGHGPRVFKIGFTSSVKRKKKIPLLSKGMEMPAMRMQRRLRRGPFQMSTLILLISLQRSRAAKWAVFGLNWVAVVHGMTTWRPKGSLLLERRGTQRVMSL
jgi:hypothetical protein